MNTAIQTKQAKTLRDLYTITDLTRSPEAFILAYNNAFEIGKAIAAEGNDYYLRSRAAALKAIELIEGGYNSKLLPLTKKQYEVLEKCKTDINALPTETDKFAEQCAAKYVGTIPNLNLKNYGF